MKIADRNHRVIVCSQFDVATKDGELWMTREGVIQGWAAIKPVKASRFSRDGQVITDMTMQPTHEIIMNYNPDINISLSAWVYEKLLKSPPRWFKIIETVNMDELSQYTKMRCRLVERTDDAIKPVGGSGVFEAVPLPEGVNL